MSRVLSWIRQLVREVLPVFLFFFAVFNLRNLTDTLILGAHAPPPLRVLTLALLAGVAAKVLLLVDLLPFVDAFRGKPLIYNTLWKTLIYGVAATLYRLVEKLVHLAREERSLGRAFQRLLDEQNWPRFWGIQIWLLALFVLFAATRELVRAIGGGPAVRRLFFRRSAA